MNAAWNFEIFYSVLGRTRIQSEVTNRILPKKTNKREVSQHLVETVTAKVSSNRVRVPLVVVHLEKKALQFAHNLLHDILGQLYPLDC